MRLVDARAASRLDESAVGHRRTARSPANERASYPRPPRCYASLRRPGRGATDRDDDTMAAIPSKKTRASRDDESTPFLGSEYMDARSYLRQPARVKASDPGSPGSNDSEIGVDADPAPDR